MNKSREMAKLKVIENLCLYVIIPLILSSITYLIYLKSSAEPQYELDPPKVLANHAETKEGLLNPIDRAVFGASWAINALALVATIRAVKRPTTNTLAASFLPLYQYYLLYRRADTYRWMLLLLLPCGYFATLVILRMLEVYKIIGEGL